MFRRHNQQISHRLRPRIPVCMDCSSRNEHATTRRCLDLIPADLNDQLSLEHVPCLVIFVVKMRWRNQASLARWASRIAPLGDNEIAVARSHDVARER